MRVLEGEFSLVWLTVFHAHGLAGCIADIHHASRPEFLANGFELISPEAHAGMAAGVDAHGHQGLVG